LVTRSHYPVHGNVNKSKELLVNEILTHPLAANEKGVSRDRWRYRYLRTTRYPTVERPNSGRILVENVVNGTRTEHYALLFNVRYQEK
jgi:hypothetical protein